jgi:hypothetical protein
VEKSSGGTGNGGGDRKGSRGGGRGRGTGGDKPGKPGQSAPAALAEDLDLVDVEVEPSPVAVEDPVEPAGDAPTPGAEPIDEVPEVAAKAPRRRRKASSPVTTL